MVITQQSGDIMLQLGHLLEQMDERAQELETITQHEYEAIRSLDAEQMMNIGNQRVMAHQSLAQLEQQSRQLLTEHQVPDQQSLSAVIDMYAGEETASLQSLRRNLYKRMLRVDQQTQENRMRLHAAYNVSSTILQSLGLASVEQTYQRRSAG
jgi:ATP-dependent protease Clp ATPase subunit